MFWCTRHAVPDENGIPAVRRTRRSNADTIGIGVLDVRKCQVKYNVSTGFFADIHGLTRVPADPNTRGIVWSRREYSLATSNKEIILRRGGPGALLRWRSVAEIIRMNPEMDPSILRGPDTIEDTIWQRYWQLEEWGQRTKWRWDQSIPQYPLWLPR